MNVADAARHGIEQDEYSIQLCADVIHDHRRRERDVKPTVLARSDCHVGAPAEMPDAIQILRRFYCQYVSVYPTCLQRHLRVFSCLSSYAWRVSLSAQTFRPYFSAR